MTHFASVDGARIAYDVQGDGPAVVLIHAGVTARGMWDEVVPLLAADHRVLRFDLRGFGETVENDEVRWTAHGDVVGVMDAAGIDRATIVGVSMGGAAALETALAHPERVRAVVAVNPGLGGLEVSDGDWALARFKQMKPAWDAGDLDAVARLEEEIWLAGEHRTLAEMPPAMLGRMHEWLLTSYAKEPWERKVELDPPAAGRLADIEVPILAVLGDLDLPSITAIVDHIAANAPTATRVTMPGTAHLSPWEQPVEFVAILRPFLAGI